MICLHVSINVRLYVCVFCVGELMSIFLCIYINTQDWHWSVFCVHSPSSTLRQATFHLNSEFTDYNSLDSQFAWRIPFSCFQGYNRVMGEPWYPLIIYMGAGFKSCINKHPSLLGILLFFLCLIWKTVLLYPTPFNETPDDEGLG